MIYINGLGYVDEGVYGISSTQGVKTATTTQASTVSSFDNILSTETAKLDQESTTTKTLNDIFDEAASKYNVSADLLKAIAYHESRFQADAVSSAGAVGIMQLMPSTAEYLGVEDSYDPYQNIMGAAKLLGKLSDMYDGNQSLMLAAYNAGSGNVDKYGGIPPFKETQEYVAKVLNTLSTGVDVPDTDITINGTTSQVATTTDTSEASSTKTQNTEYKKDATRQTDASSNTSTDTTDSFYTSSNLDDIFSYDDYQLLMSFYENMLEIISSIGETSSGNEDEADNSLLDLYQLSAQQNSILNRFTS